LSPHRPCPRLFERYGHCRRPARSRGHSNRISFRLLHYVVELQFRGKEPFMK
jgi:hypothetical protein